MNTPRAQYKLGEAQFFLNHLRKEREGDPRAFGYFLSAFLNAAYSFVEVLTVEAKRGLSAGAAASRKQAKAAFRPWYDNWVKNLSADEHQVWDLMEAQRRDEVHLLGAETVKETKGIPLAPSTDHLSTFYGLSRLVGPPNDDPPADWLEEHRRLGLAPWVRAWREAQVHHFEIAGERHDVVQTCQRYLVLLERLEVDFHTSPLATSALA